MAHRDYSIKGTDIQIKLFDDRLRVESPGTLPGLVRLNNMRTVHFSRNPKIAALLRDYGFVKEFGEGVDRMCKELAGLGLPEPEYKAESFMLHCSVPALDLGKQVEPRAVPRLVPGTASSGESTGKRRESVGITSGKILDACRGRASITIPELAVMIGVTERSIQRNIQKLQDLGLLRRVGGRKEGQLTRSGNPSTPQ